MVMKPIPTEWLMKHIDLEDDAAPLAGVPPTLTAADIKDGWELTPAERRPHAKTLYLCGPINGRTDADATNWREAVKAAWSGSCLDPMRRDYRGRELEPGIAAEIVAGDIEDIQASDVILVFFDKPSVGTSMEVFYAKHVLGKPVVIIDAQDKPLSPWLIHHSDAQFRDVSTALAHLAAAEPRTALQTHGATAEPTADTKGREG